MKTYKAMVKNIITKRITTIESQYNTKAEFIHDLRNNGYKVNPTKVKEKEIFDYIIQHTNCTPLDWKEINKLPMEN